MEYIERRKAAEILCKEICGSDRSLCVSTTENCQQKKMLELYELPAADVAPVVRCRECKHYKEHRTKKYDNLICRCTRMGKYDMDYPVKPDDFCSYGEKQTNLQTVV